MNDKRNCLNRGHTTRQYIQKQINALNFETVPQENCVKKSNINEHFK